MRHDSCGLRYASKELRNDFAFVMKVMQISVSQSSGKEPTSVDAPEQMTDRNLLLQAVRQDGLALRLASDELRKDEEVVLEAVKQNGSALKYASHELRSDREFLFQASMQDSRALIFASDELRQDAHFLMKVMHALFASSTPLSSPRNIGLQGGNDKRFSPERTIMPSTSVASHEAATFLPNIQGPMAEAFVSQEITHHTAALNVVRQDGLALRSVSDELRDNGIIVLEAVKQNSRALKYASSRLRADRDFVLTAVRLNSEAVKYASRSLRYSLEFTMAAIQQESNMTIGGSPKSFRAEAPLRSERELLLKAVRQNGLSLRIASHELRNDKEIVLEAVGQNHHALKFASTELRNDRKFVLQALLRDGRALAYASDELRNNGEFVLEACQQEAHLCKRSVSDPNIPNATVRCDLGLCQHLECKQRLQKLCNLPEDT
eukprot:TRINITY_DN32955_c0_g1_i1.p1 TRINITY_DN32955_c0_g1~~TRINITY_DN32955_c0_g1_i1.p1  ORF type:complete len:499 (+),score=96.41 TRINITY_DN32955_c0_g1_i1:195-1499(+)